MIIKRKLFTFQDKKVIKELWRATNGLRELPKGYKNLTPRDVFRLSNVTRDYYKVMKGDLNGINYEELSTLAKHLGLPETAKGAEHLIKKYNNPELLERYNRIKASRIKLSKADEKRLAEYRDLQSRKDKAMAKVDELGEVLDSYAVDYSSKNWMQQAAEREKLDKKYNRLSEKFDKEWGYGSENSDRIYELKDKLNKVLVKGYISPKTKKRLLEVIKRSQRGLKEAQSYNRRYNSPELAEEMKGIAARHNLPIELGENAGTDLTKIYLPQKHMKHPAVIGHEVGHTLHMERLGRVSGTPLSTLESKQAFAEQGGAGGLFGNPNPVYSLGDEYGATANALAKMRRLRSATPLEMANAEKTLTSAYKTYYHTSIGDLTNETAEKLVPDLKTWESKYANK